MRKRLIIAGIVGVVALALGGGVIWYQRTHQAEDNSLSNSTPGGPVALSQAQSNGVASIPLGQDSSKPLPAQPSNSLRVNDNQPQKSSENKSGRDLTPADFKQFDQYKDGQGALYQELVVGTGAESVVNKKVAVNYKGWLTSGQLFDETKDKPFVFMPGEHRVILGWEQGILGMKVGGKRRLVVPPAVGYGAQGKDPIPPNAVMVFEIELLAVEP